MKGVRAGLISCLLVLLGASAIPAQSPSVFADLPGTVWHLTGKVAYGLSGERSYRDPIVFRVSFAEQGGCEMEVVSPAPSLAPCGWEPTSKKGFALLLDAATMASILGGPDGVLSEVVKQDPRDVTVNLPFVKNRGKGTLNPKQPKISMTYAIKGTATILGHSNTRNFHLQINAKGGLAP